MFESAIEILEFPRVLEIIAGSAVSEPGREKILNLQPHTDIELVMLELTRVEEMAHLQVKGNTPPFKGIHDLRRPLKNASVAGAMLPAEVLLQFASTLGCARLVAKFLMERAREAPYLADMARVMNHFEELENAVHHAIDETGVVRDNASPELRSIRHQIASEKRRSREVMGSILRAWSAQGILQEELIATREGKLTLPVKDNLKSRANGILVDQSASGSTVYIEPIQLVEINNNIRKLELEEKREVERILKELTAIVFRYRFEIEDTFKILIEIDTVFARAEYALKFDCCRPKIGISEGLRIVRGRHPLLLIKEKQVVPLEMEIPPEIHTLVISGPNAGGKTVSLKTVGLLTIMAMSGCFIPADENTRLPFPREIHAIIGDDQSIAADLSTFTAHVSKLSKVVATSDPRKLVLVDEIMSGTDPTEGTSLAISILERLTAEGALTLVTTHKGDLKAFAHRTEGVMNGSLDFDPINLLPTYRFRSGVPGSSYAFAIAKRVGLGDDITERAKFIRGEGQGSLDNLIIELQDKLVQIEREKIELEQRQREAQSLQNQLDDKLKRAREIEKKLKEKATEEAEKILADAGRIVEQAVREIKQAGASKDSIKAARENIDQAKTEISRRRKKKQKEITRRDWGPIQIGDRVKLEDSEIPAVVTQGKDSRGRFLIESGGIKIWVDEERLIKLPQEKPEKGKKAKPSKISIRYDIDTNISAEIDLRGLDSTEAADKVEKYLHKASLANLHEVSIIHGKGDGVLRKVVADILALSELVKSSRPGGWGEGDYGITKVELE